MATPPASMINLVGYPDLDGKFTSNFDPESTSPAQFSFTAVTDATLGDVYEASATINGIPSGSAPISADGEYKINDGEYTLEAGTVNNGDTVTVKGTAAEEPVSITVTIGAEGEEVTGAFSISVPSTVGLVAFANFSDGEILPTTLHEDFEWSVGAYNGGIQTVEDGVMRLQWHQQPDGGGFTVLNLNFPGPGSDNFPNGVTEFWIEYKVKMNPGHSIKIFKIFGIPKEVIDGGGYSNSTYGLGTDGLMSQVSFGDGHGDQIDNDTSEVINLTGYSPSSIGRSYGMDGNIVLTPYGADYDYGDGEWHTVRIHHKFDSSTPGNVVNDGEMFISVDGITLADAVGLLNRHPTNMPIWYISLANYAQEYNFPFDVFLDDIKVSLNGWPE